MYSCWGRGCYPTTMACYLSSQVTRGYYLNKDSVMTTRQFYQPLWTTPNHTRSGEDEANGVWKSSHKEWISVTYSGPYDISLNYHNTCGRHIRTAPGRWQAPTMQSVFWIWGNSVLSREKIIRPINGMELPTIRDYQLLWLWIWNTNILKTLV